ncbi:MAG: SMP-30/gluconolactonase/LRE family protein [Pseudomonadota bacterium]|nr:SMP-30/gluconolactonase/LRE family protein [Pseudomonadota bacterium]
MRPALLLLLAACTGAPKDDTGEAPVVDVCWTDLAPGDAAPVATGFADGTEGVSFVDGRLYVTVPTGVVEVGADGTVTPIVTLDHALGLAPAEGGLFVADPGEFTFDGSGDDGRVHFVDLGIGAARMILSGMPNPNFIATLPSGGLLVSDDTIEEILHADGADVAVWTSLPSPNGMALAPDASALYVATTFVTDPPLWRVPLAADGTPGTAEVVTTFDTGAAPDGLAVSADGAVWVALNLENEIVRVDPETGEDDTLTTAVTTPASLAFGAGEAFDPCSLYVTELYGDTVWRVATGTPGAPIPVAPAP